MQIAPATGIYDLVAAYNAAQTAIRAFEAIDSSPVADAATELVRDRRDQIADALARLGLRPCGTCKVAKAGAVDWGCTCDLTAAEQAAAADRFAPIHN
jgi:hypothetical protein